MIMRTYKDGTMGAAGSNGSIFQGEKGLVATGLLGLLLAGLCAIWVLLNGGPVGPDGDVSKAISFDAALGVFVLSTAAILPLSAMKAKLKTLFSGSYIVLALYAYAAETVQNMRGVNPRFVEDGSAFDIVVGAVFGLVALLLVLLYIPLAVQFFRKKAYRLRPGMVVGARYAMIAVMLSFAAGIWISMNQGRFTGEHGNIIWLHGLGFHALQVLPLVAWLAERTTLPEEVRKLGIHLTGMAYLLGLAAIGGQTLLGEAMLEWSLIPMLALSFFLLTIILGAFMLREARAAAVRRSYQRSGAGIR